MSTIRGRVTEVGTTTFTVELLELAGAASATLSTRPRGSGDSAAWTSHGSSGAVGGTISPAGLTEGADLEWRLQGPGGEDGQHGYVTPAASLWSTLTATVAAALEGQGLAAARIYVGRQPEPNYAEVVAVVRTLPERVVERANNVECVAFPVGVEFRVTLQDDDGREQKVEVERWQRRLEAALHEKYAGDFPGVAGLEQTLVEIVEKDAREGRDEDEHQEDVVARAVVLFVVWRNK